MVLLEFTAEGPPVSHQTSDKANLQAWKKAVRDEAAKVWTSAPVTDAVKFVLMNFMDIEHAVAQVAEEYRREGYQVISSPGPDQVPPFAQGHEVDLVASRDGEKILVVVKTSREDLQKDAQLLRIAEAIKRQPGWRLDLVVLNADAPAYRVSPDASEPTAEDIRRNLDQAEHLAKTDGLPVAVVMSWAALEAAMRWAARRTGIEPGAGAPSFLLGALYSRGPLHREEFDRLSEAMKVRNAVVHGMSLPAIDATLPQYIISVARRLLSQNGSAPNS
jgi:hypothetical protein